MKFEDFEKQLNEEAPRWVGTGFCFRGYTKLGADCIGVIVGVLRVLGADMPDDDGGIYEPDWFLHDRSENRYLDGWLTQGSEVDVKDRRAGDVICFWSVPMKKVTHSALYLGNGKLVHSHKRDNGVKILDLSTPWVRGSRQTWIRLDAVKRLTHGG